MRRRSFAVLTVAALVTLGACTSALDGSGKLAPRGSVASPSASGSGPRVSALPGQPKAKFRDCASAFNLDSLSFPAGRQARLSFGCATISVPLDYSKPSGKTIDLTMVKVHDSANTNPIGSLLVNPGGPGGSGIELGVGLAAQLSDTILSHFDIIGFDPRGVGASSPIRCLSDTEKDELNAASPDVRTAAGFREARAAAAKVATACTDKYGPALADYNTVQTAKDMDRIRQSVGDPKMNFLGFSYGTELGSIYAHLFPGRIRVAVLDGAVDPLTDDITSFANQLDGFEKAFDQFAAYCVKTTPCSDIGNPRQAVYKIAATSMKAPIPSSAAGETRKATSSLVYTGVLSALYSRSSWPTLGAALKSALGGDSSGLLSLADQYNQRSPDGTYANISDANTTIGCNDSKPGPSDATIRATTTSWAKRFPIFGLWSAPSLFSCQQWQPDRTVVPLPKAATPHTVLVIGNINDPATPYQGAIDLAKTMGNAEVLTWDGEGHTSFLQGSTCIDNYVDSYLVDGTLPPVNTTCK
ncbi:MAG: alpha/beta hydrolase [Jatrophihabitans sp.]